MQVLSLLLKILAALSAIVGVVTFIFDIRNRPLASIPPKHLLPIGIVLFGIALACGVIDYVTSRSGSGSESRGPTTTIMGPNYGVALSAQTISGLTFHTGDSPEERARKQQQARAILATEIVDNARALDVRIGLVRSALVPDDFEARFKSESAAVAPNVARIATEAYATLISRQTAASLRQAISSVPLRVEAATLATQLVPTAAVSSDDLTAYYGQLREAVYRTDVLLTSIEAGADRKAADPVAIRRVDLARRGLEVQSELAYVHGLKVLAAMPAEASAHGVTIGALANLTPRQLVDARTAQAHIARVGSVLATLRGEKAKLPEQMRSARDAELTRGLAESERSLTIDAVDPWNIVVAKAMSLRQLGRTDDAIAAYARYGSMFAATDPGAAMYARIAQAFTRQTAPLGVHGGVYVFQIDPGPAASGGVRVGDILVRYAGEAITSLPELDAATTKHERDADVAVVFLRYREDTERFLRLERRFRPGKLGAGFMPI
ncbi:MAG TPA: PDZ domain-containing protein [Thermoanaerobaculia bacterium]|nr:PDZ domain-containing protein [Thermoanaerobaculia bacterium]